MELDLKALTEATAGAVGGAVSTTILYPLDTCKTKFQAEARADGTNKYRSLLDVLKEAVSCGKVMSLYQGLATKNGHAIVSGFVYFYSYSYIRRKYLEYAGVSKMGTAANLVVAAVAGACTACTTQPLDTLSARMQTSKPGEAKGFLQLLREEGFWHAYDGLGISLILTVNPAIQYTVFEQLKNQVLERQQARQALKASSVLPTPGALSALAAFAIGAISKCAATIITYPLIRCKVLMQRAETTEEKEQRRCLEKGTHAIGPPQTMAQAFRIIWHSEGFPGFYKGLRAQILKTVIAAALMLMIKEKVSDTSRLLVLALHRLLTSTKATTLEKTTSTPLRASSSDHTAHASAGSSPIHKMLPSIVSTHKPIVTSIPIHFNGGKTRDTSPLQIHLLAADEGAV